MGKSDPHDAHRITAAVLVLECDQLRRPRLADGVRAALRVLVTARDHMTSERTATINALIARLRTVDLGIDARRVLTSTQLVTISRWRARDEDLGIATAEARPSVLPNL
ncbi:IS110 family transposase [Dietzia lutea]|uniref:IS110 family transposase n=1 Tax=Dietzia lutea TaxID=546160 RepID=UPI00132F52DA|nr:transposase [Dietzia lutea]